MNSAVPKTQRPWCGNNNFPFLHNKAPIKDERENSIAGFRTFSSWRASYCESCEGDGAARSCRVAKNHVVYWLIGIIVYGSVKLNYNQMWPKGPRLTKKGSMCSSEQGFAHCAQVNPNFSHSRFNHLSFLPVFFAAWLLLKVTVTVVFEWIRNCRGHKAKRSRALPMSACQTVFISGKFMRLHKT